MTFTPTALGTPNVTLTVSHSGANSPQTASLSGTGVQPAVTLSPTSLSVPTQVVFTTSQHNVKLTNSGTSMLAITNVAASGDFNETNNCAGTTIAGNLTCTIQVRFLPTAIGNRGGLLTVYGNVAGGS